MDGIHDLGGEEGFGHVEVGDSSSSLDRWQASVVTMVGALRFLGINTDYFRHCVERIHPIAYLTHSYYGRWLGGAETALVEAGILSQEEINKRVRTINRDVGLIAARPKGPMTDLRQGIPETAHRTSKSAPAFAIGDQVQTSEYGTSGHTRLPAYARSKVGHVTAHHDTWVFPDANAHGKEQAQHLYSVEFSGRELWGPEADDSLTVSLDLFEGYLTKI